MNETEPNPIEPHLSDVELAQLAELGNRDFPERAAAHLARCARCMAALAEIAEARQRWRDRSLETSSAAWTEMGKAIAAGGREGIREPSTRGRRRWKELSLATLAAASVLGVLWLNGSHKKASFQVPPEVHAAIARSAGAGLELPGFESDDAVDRVVLRGDEGEPLRAFIGQLESETGAREGSADRTYLLAAAALAEGRLHSARAYAEAGRRLAPRDERFLVVAAVVAYRESDLDQARELLEEALRAAPRSAVVKRNLELVTSAILRSP